MKMMMLQTKYKIFFQIEDLLLENKIYTKTKVIFTRVVELSN
jgi:hypothetical protein